MEVTGGALIPDTSWWYIIDCVPSKGKWTAYSNNVNLDVTDTNSSDKKYHSKDLDVMKQLSDFFMDGSG